VDANGTSVVVVRDASLPQSNAALPATHAERVGEGILAWMDEKFPTLAPKVLPTASTPLSASALLDGVRQIAAIFAINEFMLLGDVRPLADGSGLQWTLVAPANLWSAQVLRVRGDNPVNDFEVKTVLAYLRRCGVPASATTQFEKGTQVTHEFRWIGVPA
jgi:hypothetical protein